jgi:transposase InsO family protein
MDITYIPMARGFVYLTAVMDWFTRRVLAWRVSMKADFCIEAVEEALAKNGKPEIFNTDQGGAAQGSACAAGGMAAEGANSPVCRSLGCY